MTQWLCSLDKTPQKSGPRTSATLSVSSLFAAFGCAACCALPVMLVSTALAGSWTLHLQLLVGPYERWWFWGTVFLLCLSTASWANSFWISVKRDTIAPSVLTFFVTPIILACSFLLFGITLMVEPAILTSLNL